MLDGGLLVGREGLSDWIGLDWIGLGWIRSDQIGSGLIMEMAEDG